MLELGGAPEQPSEIATGETPFEGLRDLLIVVLKGENALRGGVEGREIIGCQCFALKDREVDLDLVEPARVNRQVDQDVVTRLSFLWSRLLPSTCSRTW